MASVLFGLKMVWFSRCSEIIEFISVVFLVVLNEDTAIALISCSVCIFQNFHQFLSVSERINVKRLF